MAPDISSALRLESIDADRACIPAGTAFARSAAGVRTGGRELARQAALHPCRSGSRPCRRSAASSACLCRWPSAQRPTHLHNALAASGAFTAVPPVIAALPWERRTVGPFMRPFVEPRLPSTRLIDKVEVRGDDPTEDEIGLANAGPLSYFHAFTSRAGRQRLPRRPAASRYTWPPGTTGACDTQVRPNHGPAG